MSITALQPHDVSARIHYFKDAEDGSHPTLEEIEFLVPKFVDAQQVTIRNVRGFEKDFNFTDHGFQFLQSEWPFEGPLDDETAVEQVRPAAEELLKKCTGASRVIAFNHVVRSSAREQTGIQGQFGPAVRAHNDLAPSLAPSVLVEHCPQDMAKIMGRRWQVVNVWRPLKPIFRDPFAVTDGSTIPVSDYSLQNYPPRSDREPIEIFFTKADNVRMHKWYYLHAQRPDEVVIFKTFDSDVSAKIRMVTHSAFVDPEYENFPKRESIEVRCIVCY